MERKSTSKVCSAKSVSVKEVAYSYAIQAANDGSLYVGSCFLLFRVLLQLIDSLLKHFIDTFTWACVKVVLILKSGRAN